MGKVQKPILGVKRHRQNSSESISVEVQHSFGEIYFAWLTFDQVGHAVA
jgi:hypothetical protein